MTNYVATNTYTNIGVSNNSQAESINVQLSTTSDAVTPEQYAEERRNDANQSRSNPEFLLTAYSNPLISKDSGIKRGYIRRSNVDIADKTSNSRLYFMYNPANIQRQYMAYLDQQALDPYNTMFGSNNMTAPPGILDFSFELFFDRHLEVAQDANHPGVKVDYDYFDLVVRGVVQGQPNSGNAIPDNGIMISNPKNIAVIFGKDLSVHGRPYNSSVRFEKFDHKMTPTRMVISITLKAFYVGPVQSIPTFSQIPAENVYTATIPYDSDPIYKQPTAVDRISTSYGAPIGIGYSPIPSPTSPVPSPYVSNDGAWTVSPRDGSRPGFLQGFVGPYQLRITRTSNSNSVYSSVEPVAIPGSIILRMLQEQECPLEGAITLWALAKRESNFITNATGINNNGTYDIGLWQINNPPNPGFYPKEVFTDPWVNIKAAMSMSNNGTSFKPWNRPINGNTYANYQVDDNSYLLGINRGEAVQFFRDAGFPT